MTPGTETALPGRHDGRRRTVLRTWRTDQLTAYWLVSDVVATAACSAEVLGVVWDERVEEDLPSVGDRFTARNRMGGTHWTSTATVVEAEPGRRFAFAVGSVERPTAVWSFDLSAVDVPVAGTATTVEYTVVLGSGPSMFDTIRHLGADRYDAIVDERLDGLSASMANMLHALGACVDPRRFSRRSVADASDALREDGAVVATGPRCSATHCGDCADSCGLGGRDWCWCWISRLSRARGSGRCE